MEDGDDASAAVSPSTALPTAASWDVDLLEAVANVMELEVLMLHPAPIGLRLHLADVWVDEAVAAGGEDMPTQAFLVSLAPWLRAAAAPDTNAVVFQRVVEGVFKGMLAFFPKQGGDEEGAEEGAVFKKVELEKVQACLFEVATEPQVCKGGS